MAVILPPVPSVARFALAGTWQGQPFINIFHGQYSNAPGDAVVMGQICAAVQTAYHNSFGALQGADCITTGVQGIDLASRQGVIGTGGTNLAGGSTNSSANSVQIAIVASWKIADRYRGGHPRTYLPGITSTDLASGHLITSTAQLAWKNAAAGFLTNFNAMTVGGSSWKLVCVRYFSQHQLLPNPFVRLIGGSDVHRRLDSQRRRLGKEVP